MNRCSRAVLASSSLDAACKLRTAKLTLPETKSTAKGRASISPAVKKTTEATQQPKKTGKRKVTTTVSPPTKRQKITETVTAIPESDTTKPTTPNMMAQAAQDHPVKPRFQMLPETPTSTIKKKAVEEVYEIQEGDSDHGPQSIAIHSSRNRQLKSKITRLKSQIARAPKEPVAQNIVDVDDTPSKTPKVEATQKIAKKTAMQDGEPQMNKHAVANVKFCQVSRLPEDCILVSKADYSILMRRTVVVNKMVMTFTESANDVEDTNNNKKNPALTHLLAEARSLSFGVQSLTNAITKLPAKGDEDDISIAQLPIGKEASENDSLLTIEDPAAANQGGAIAKQSTDGPGGDVIVVKPISMKKTEDDKEESCVKVPPPAKRVVFKLSK
ncbi:hypothetical protein CSPAE12_05291 [Colletotrichum incanum]|nr:hypothetical protein CSPAE12_05291 [Colletotrichum incanum]